MKIRVIGFICMALLLLVYACESDSSIEFKRYYSSGRVVYHDRCQNCHGGNGEGLAALIPPLTDSAFLRANKQVLACIIKNGLNAPIKISGRVFNGAMPAASLTPIEIAQVITYAGNSFGNKMGLVTGDDAGAELAKCN